MSGIGSIAAASVDAVAATEVRVVVEIGIGGIDVDTVGDRGGCAGGDPFQAECAW